MSKSEMAVNTFSVLAAKFNALLVVPPNLKEDELLVKRKEWNKAKSLMDETLTSMGVVQAEFQELGLLQIEQLEESRQLERQWKEMNAKIQAEASAKTNRAT